MREAGVSPVIIEPATIARNPDILRLIAMPSKPGIIRLREPITRAIDMSRSTMSAHQLF